MEDHVQRPGQFPEGSLLPLEKLNAHLARLTALMEQQVILSEKLLNSHERTESLLERELAALLDEPLMDKNDVMHHLNISDATYRRYVDNGKLNPMNLGKIDWYNRRDLAQQLEESRRKGRI